MLPRTLIYQVFVDRFAGPGGAPLAVPPPDADPWKHHCGGRLDGIAAKLDHIVDLGADAIYLTPIFRAATNHKYDTASWDEVDSVFGGDAAFETLVAACRARGLGLILDGVFNHVGEEHDWFRKAKGDARSPLASYFKFTRHPDEYARWRGFGFLPELDLANPRVLEALFDGQGSVVRRWIKRGATGWRLDCANDLGIANARRAAAAARDAGAADGAIGEVMAFADAWLAEGGLDGVMNYWFRESALGLARGEVPAAQVAANFEEMARRYPPAGLHRSWNILSSHDTPRLATTVPDAAARALARVLAFAAPGVPVCYYGEEVGMKGGPDPDNRGPMIWDERNWDRATLTHVRKLATIRRAQRALREGRYLPMPQPGTPALLAFARTTERPEETVVVVANGSAKALTARVFAPHAFLLDALPMVDLLGAAPPVRMQAGRFDVELPPWGAALYLPDDTTIPGYKFLRR